MAVAGLSTATAVPVDISSTNLPLDLPLDLPIPSFGNPEPEHSFFGNPEPEHSFIGNPDPEQVIVCICRDLLNRLSLLGQSQRLAHGRAHAPCRANRHALRSPRVVLGIRRRRRELLWLHGRSSSGFPTGSCHSVLTLLLQPLILLRRGSALAFDAPQLFTALRTERADNE